MRDLVYCPTYLLSSDKRAVKYLSTFPATFHRNGVHSEVYDVDKLSALSLSYETMHESLLFAATTSKTGGLAKGCLGTQG